MITCLTVNIYIFMEPLHIKCYLRTKYHAETLQRGSLCASECNLTEDQRTTEPPEPAEPIISFLLTSELRACARASSRYDVANGTRSLARSIDRFL